MLLFFSSFFWRNKYFTLDKDEGGGGGGKKKNIFFFLSSFSWSGRLTPLWPIEWMGKLATIFSSSSSALEKVTHEDSVICA